MKIWLGWMLDSISKVYMYIWSNDKVVVDMDVGHYDCMVAREGGAEYHVW